MVVSVKNTLHVAPLEYYTIVIMNKKFYNNPTRAKRGKMVKMTLFTDREKNVLFMIARGEAYEVIASELGMSRKTVAKTASVIYDKLGARTAAQAVAIAMIGGYFTKEELQLIRNPKLPSKAGLQMLVLFEQGKSDQEIADELSYALDTVKQYLTRVIRVLRVNTRREAVAKAKQLRLIAA